MPVSIAARGMLACSASSGSCAMVRPPRSLMRLIPIAPSPSAPESTIAAACGPCVSASERKNRSTATRLPRRRLQIGQPQMPVVRGEMLARRNHINAVRLDLHTLRRLHHAHLRRAPQQVRQRALVLRREVQDHHESHPAIRRHRGEKFAAAPRCSPPTRRARPSAPSCSRASARCCRGCPGNPAR